MFFLFLLYLSLYHLIIIYFFSFKNYYYSNLFKFIQIYSNLLYFIYFYSTRISRKSNINNCTPTNRFRRYYQGYKYNHYQQNKSIITLILIIIFINTIVHFK
ncbi:hypothetical protein EDI_102130 [Entamoeba dispar SAW760]|uniref:Uncharacterized protein n=1 Tax=Entamoeba dispar (strain ATCC PRA-260 / SAW760) TaxID=370354 RepID=B0EAT8_ENTDS|nr:uncharacterized protein EDI_102130 [Entamoeba dispar SAW760]EDR28348.1 hypothetical protein EDI_102130 [Entamoeba dispar SAW760]|eukprot:EDR28348.1 hypothetical protein EDI_102130 [Entamoeba dispar SAW760]